MSKSKAGNSTAEGMVSFLSSILRQSKMQTKEGKLVMVEFRIPGIRLSLQMQSRGSRHCSFGR